MNKRGALLAAEDFVFSIIILIIFFVIVMNLVEDRRESQRREIVAATAEMESSSALTSLLRMPFGETKTVGNILVESLYESNNPFSLEMSQMIKSYLDSQFDAQRVSWQFQLQSINAEQYPLYSILGTNGHLCRSGRTQVASVKLPVFDAQGNSLYSATLSRCFENEQSLWDSVTSWVGGLF